MNHENLVNEKDIDVKWECDPTEAVSLKFAPNTTWKQVFLEVTQFIDNNNNNTDEKYLEYPKLYLNSNKPKCQDESKCEQCRNNNINASNNYNAMFSLCLCSTKRREIGNHLFDNAREQQCKTKSVFAVTRKLFLSDKVLIPDSKTYKLYPNWFAKVYSFLVWQQQVVEILLHNLVQRNGDGDHEWEEKKNNQFVTISGAATESKVNDCDTKFDLLTSLHCYLHELIECLVFYYCCFDSQLWIAVFYPFIEVGIGTLHCKMLFAQSDKDCVTVKSICDEALVMDENVSTRELLSKTTKYLQETKAIVILKRVLCNMYGTRDNEIECSDDDTAKIMYNPFDLAHKIHIKLQETINNIKTQLLTTEMTGINADKSNNDTNNETNKQILKELEEGKDDWVADKSNIGDKNKMKIEAPNFIRLFVIRRIISKYLNNDTEKQKETKIQGLANVFKKNLVTQLVVRDIITRLIRDGLKQYMNKWYNEEEQLHIIEMIFKKIIIQRFSKEYNEFVNYVGTKDANSNNKSNCNLVFNSTDLMCNIFQYLAYEKCFDGDLSVCNLVNSHWLYIAWNPNSVYFFDLTDIIFITYSYHIYNGIDIKRMWQRLVNARSVYINDDEIDGVRADAALLSKISMLRKVESIDVHLHSRRIGILNTIMDRCGQRMTKCAVDVYSDADEKNEDQISPLMLPNARYICIKDLYCYRIWSYKCETILLNVTNMNQEWYRYVVLHCDCSGVTDLELCLVRNKNNEKKINQKILKSFAGNFSLLRRLKLIFYKQFDINVLLLWQFLKSMIHKNNGTVEVILDDDDEHKLEQKDADFIIDTMEKQDLKIDKITKSRQNGEITGKIIEGWVIGSIIAQGGFGKVYEAKNASNGVSGAAKFIELYESNDERSERHNEMIRNEIDVLTKSNHKNIIQLISYKTHIYVTVEEKAILVFECMENGNLYDYLKSNKRFDLAICKRFFDQIVDGVDYLHNELHIAHRDLNPKNLLLDDNFNIKICDFGCCKMINQESNDNCDNIDESKTETQESSLTVCHSTRLGTPGYIAPEIGYKKQYLANEEEKLLCDVFSLGIILWKMLVGIDSKPFDDFDNAIVTDFDDEPDSIKENLTYKLLEDGKYDLWWKNFKNDNQYYHDDDLKNLFVKMFDPLPKTRIRIRDIKNNQWYKKTNEKNKHKHNSNQEYLSAKMKQMFIRKEFTIHNTATATTEVVTPNENNIAPANILRNWWMDGNIDDDMNVVPHGAKSGRGRRITITRRTVRGPIASNNRRRGQMTKGGGRSRARGHSRRRGRDPVIGVSMSRGNTSGRGSGGYRGRARGGRSRGVSRDMATEKPDIADISRGRRTEIIRRRNIN